MTGRQLNVAPAVAQQLPAAHLAQLQAEVNDPDNRCPHCHQLIEGRTAEAIILKDGDFHLARLAHPECARSGIYEAPGVRATFAAQLVDGLDITTRLGRRRGPKPRAVVFIELLVHVSAAAPGGDLTAAEDPLTVYARTLGLEPVTGGLEQITPSHITTSSLHVDADGEGLTLTHPAGQDTISTDPKPLAAWCKAAREDHGTALLITARGLGLVREPPTITRALTTQPAWGASLTVTGLPRRRRWWTPRRRR